MKLVIVCIAAVAASLAVSQPAALAQITMDFETPFLGANDRMMINPYVDPVTGTVFTCQNPNGVIGLVKNSATSACVDPPDANQKLGTGGDGGSIGLSDFAMKATFADAIPAPVTISVEFQALAGTPVSLQLFRPNGTLVGFSTLQLGPPVGNCGYPGFARGRLTVTAEADVLVGWAIVKQFDNSVFVVDDFTISSPPVATADHSWGAIKAFFD